MQTSRMLFRRRLKSSSAPNAEPKPNDIRHIVQLLSRFLVGERRLFILALVMLIAEAGTAVFEAYPLAYLIDYLKGDRPDLITFLGLPQSISPLIGTIAILTAAIILMAMINSLADSLAEIYLAKGGRLLGYNLRVALYAHLQRLSLAFHDKRRTGDILTRVTGDVAALEDFVIGSLSDIVGSLLVLVGTMAFLLTHSWEVSLVGVVIIPVMAFISNYFSQRIKEAAKKQRAREGDLASAAQEMLTSIRVIQTYSRAGYEQGRFAEHSLKTMDAALVAAGLQARFSWVVKVMEALAISIVVWLGLWLMNRSALTVGTLLLFIVLIQNMFKPTRKIIKEWNTIGKIYASVERIGELLDRKPTVIDEPGAIEAPALQGYVEFQHVSFAYQPDPEEADEAEEQLPLALKDISFAIAPGEVLALVGHTGAGKSTIAQLLPRLYDPADGQVLIDGHNIRTFTLDSLRSQISVVLQETILFSGSVAENIAYGRTDATRAEIVEAAIQANAHEFIEKLAEGYDALLGERGANLSGGQRQRIAIARAFIRNAPILILDEPTTGLDVEAAELVLLALRTLMKGKTTIIISHDLKLIRHADKIVVIKEGEIEQMGTHQELLQSEGLYASLYFKQFSQFEAEPSDSEVKPDEPALPDSEGSTATGFGPSAPAREAPASLSAPGAIHRNGRQAVGTAGHLAQATQLDLLHNPLLESELPGLVTAFDAVAMKTCLQGVFFGEPSRYTIEQCTPGKATYLDGEGCILRYTLDVQDKRNGTLLTPLVNARLFASQKLGQAYLRDRLIPLAALMDGRPEIAPFATPVAFLESLNMVVSVFPIDGELPTLVGASNSQRMLGVFREVLPVALAEPFTLEACRVEPGHYGRQHRCVLRYQVEGRRPDFDGEPVSRVFYGKVAADGRGLMAGKAITALCQQALNGHHAYSFNIPRFLGYRRDLQLALLESIPGSPQIGQLLKARLNGAADSQSDALTLEEALDAGAHIAAALHTSGISVGYGRTLNNEVARLRREVAAVQRLSPELGANFQKWLARVEAQAAESSPLPLCFSHGDFTHTQLLFDDAASGLVDFDTICQAEPALDLGQFLAYLRVAVLKAQKAAALPADDLAERLGRCLLDTYVAAAGYKAADEAKLRSRVPLYEVISLLRIALHSWQKLKGGRLDHVMTLLEQYEAMFTTSALIETSKVLDQLLEPTEWDKLRSSMTPEWLAAVTETERVHTLLTQRVTEFASGRLTLHDCEIKRLRLRDESGCWSGTYQLTIEGPKPGQHRIVPIRGTLIPPNLPEPAAVREEGNFGAEQWRYYLPELRLELEMQSVDTGLPALPHLTDPEQACVLLEEGIRAGAETYGDLRIQACTPRVMRYKPGSRCTILYDLEYPTEVAKGRNWPQIVVAKTYFGDKGKNAYEAMRALWNSPLAKSSSVTIAEPLAYLPDLNVLLQGPIREETTLKELLRSALHAGTPEAMDEFSDYMRKTAVGLAELHRSGAHYGQLVTWEDELEEIRQRRDRLAVPIPQLTDAADSLLARLERLAAEHPADPPLPSHRSFRPAQVLLHKGEIGFIDFDGFCQAEPALDLALFMVKIKHIALTKPGEDEEVALMDETTRLARLAQMETICERFLSEYEKYAPVSRPRIMLWEALDVLSLVLGCWTKIKTWRLDNTIFMLERLLQANGLASGL